MFDDLFNKINSFISIMEKPAPIDIFKQPDEIVVKPSIDITINKTIREKYKKGWIWHVRPTPPTRIILHGTGGGSTIPGFLKWMYDGERATNYYKGISLFHNLIGRDGEIVEIIDPMYYVAHATSGWSGAKQEIGIEIINSSKSNRDPYTDAQYDSLFRLIKYYLEKYPTITEISSHRYNIIRFNPKTYNQYLKQCPGPGFDWKMLGEALTHINYTFKEKPEFKYNIAKA